MQSDPRGRSRRGAARPFHVGFILLWYDERVAWPREYGCVARCARADWRGRPVTRHEEERMRILVVEDEQRIAAFLEKGLAEKHYLVDLAGDGETALDLVAVQPYDLIIL